MLGKLPYSLGAGSKVNKAYIDALKAHYGDAFIINDSTPYRRAELFALAQVFLDFQSQIRRAQCEVIPGLATQTLDEWVERLGIDVSPNDNEQSIRDTASARYQAVLGATSGTVVDAIDKVLGGALVQINFSDGYFAETYTYWPGVNPGSPAVDIGGDAQGQWSSIRSKVLVVMKQLPGQSLNDVLEIVNTKLSPILDNLLPVYATWSWDISTEPYSEGFVLNQDLLNFNTL